MVKIMLVMLKVLKFLLLIVIVLGILFFFFKVQIENFILSRFSTVASNTFVSSISATPQDIEIYASNLDVPWEVVFLPSQEMLVTLRKGELLIYNNKNIINTFKINDVNSEGEGGLLGVAVHPNFESNNYVYLYFTTKNNNRFENRVARYLYKNGNLDFDKIILSDIRGNIYHNAGKIAFGPDGFLYITAGDALDEPLAQNKSVLAGKILRVDAEGKFPKDNPFNNEVYSFGHRNPQGLTWDSENILWSTEHGQSGLKSGQDELNKITKGSNYGWPLARGNQDFPNFVSPIIHSGDNETWAPGDTEYYAGNIFFTGLRGSGIYRYDISNKTLTKYLENQFGRLRAITLGPDGFFYITTSNKDGRGTPKDGDDKILKINPRIFFN